MRTRRSLVLATTIALGLAASAIALRPDDETHAALAAPPASLARGRVAMLVTHARAGRSTLYAIDTDEPALGAPLASFAHAEDAAVRASVLGDGEGVVAIADTLDARDLSFAASVFLLRPHAPATELARDVVHASRPLVAPSGRVFVSRGTPGASAIPRGELRTDALTIDEIDPASGALRTVHATLGYVAFLAGALDDELFVYRVGAWGADLVAVNADSGDVRAIVPKLAPFARDFSVDRARRALVFTGRDEARGAWTIERVGLARGERERLWEGSSMSVAPHATTSGSLAWSPDGREGLAWLDAPNRKRAPLGDGVDLIVADALDAPLVAGAHLAPSGGLATPFVLDTSSLAARALPVPDGARATIAGFVKEGFR